MKNRLESNSQALHYSTQNTATCYNYIQVLNRYVEMNATAACTFYFKWKGLKLQYLNFVSVTQRNSFENKKVIFTWNKHETTLKTTSTLITESPGKECFTNPQVLILPVTSTQYSKSCDWVNTNFNVLSANVCFCCLTIYYCLQKLLPRAVTPTSHAAKMRGKRQFYSFTSQSKTLTCPSATWRDVMDCQQGVKWNSRGRKCFVLLWLN